VADRIRALFSARGRQMPASNLRQADVPEGAGVIEQQVGTAPGLICPVGNKVVYALPGVPYELRDMFVRGVLPDLRRRLAAEGTTGVIVSRVLRTWGLSESRLGEVLADRIAALDRAGGNPSLALLASGIEGIKVRITAKAVDTAAAMGLIDAEELEIRSVVGDAVFGTDDDTMETAVARQLGRLGWSLGVAESLTGGLVSSRLVAQPGASTWYRGAVVSYATEVKNRLMGVPDGPVVSEPAAVAMARGAARALGSDVGLALTGVAGPAPAEGHDPGTVFVAMVMPGVAPVARRLQLPGDRERVRQMAVISALDVLRRQLAVLPATS
jgi:nicotinamide-nucleotide amidase